MEEKDLIFLGNEIKTDGVLVEINKKRQTEKAKRIFKRGIVILLLLGLIFGSIKLMPEIKELLSNKGNGLNISTPIVDSDSDTESSKNSDTSTETNEEEKGSINNENSDTSPDKSTESDKESSNLSSDTSTETESNESADTSVGAETEKESAHKIIETGKTKYQAVNESGCDFDFSSEFQKVSPNDISKKYGSDAPLVLITHSHGNESYSNGKSYIESDSFYSENSNVSSLGKIICDRLNAYGIPAIQLSEIYASGAIYGSQREYEKSLEETLKKYPSISYVFDISRGIKINDDLSMSKSYITKDKEKLAQITLITGTNWDTASKNQTENVRFAFDFGNFLNTETEGYVKKNAISRFSLSQNIEPFSVNVEIGEYANSYEEAKRSAELFSTLLYRYLSK